MHAVPLLINITLAMIVAFFGGVIARRIGLPTIVGYLLAGIAIGPFTPGFVGDIGTIQLSSGCPQRIILALPSTFAYSGQ